MKIRTLIIGAALTLSLGACSKSKFDKLLSEADSYTDKMCACTDKECTDKVHKEFKEWQKSSEKDFTEDDLKNISASQIEKAEESEKKMKECRKKYDK